MVSTQLNVRDYYCGGTVGGDTHIILFKYVKSCHVRTYTYSLCLLKVEIGLPRKCVKEELHLGST